LGIGAVIVLDTHIWVWWVHGDASLPADMRDTIAGYETDRIGVSAISCWEVAKLVEYGRLVIPVAVSEWMDKALSYPGIELIELSPQIAIASTQLPGTFHKDPADQIIVATARILDCPLVTLDGKICGYEGVRLLA
jgi:PIN domain nuclease of toxin-antitoxin system